MNAAAAIVDSVAAFAPEDWDRCFPGEVEGWRYYRASEIAGIPDFDFRYVAVLREGHPIAVAPAFITRYRLDTTLQGACKGMTERLARLAPGLLSIRMVCLGSPVAEKLHLGFAPEIGPAERPRLFEALIAEMKRFASFERIPLIAVKDMPQPELALFEACLAGFKRLPGLPTAWLPLPFGDVDLYLASLGAATRKDLRRKLRHGTALRIEHRRDISDVLDRVAELYEQTVDHSELRFERLPPEYFSAVLREYGPGASCVLYWHGDRLVAFNLVLAGRDRLIDKYVGMDYAFARRFSLYFISWLTNVRYCIEHRIPLYQSGQAFYAPKLRLGSRLTMNWQFFRHRNPVLNLLLRVVSRLVRLDRFDPELQALLRSAK